MKARRNALWDPTGEAAHAGLVLDKYLACHEKDKTAKSQTLQAAIAAAKKAQGLYRWAFERRKALREADSRKTYQAQLFSTPPHSRLLIGHGEESVLEVGLTLHHTYGVPVIPGTALKGLSSHYCDMVWGQRPLEGEEDSEDRQALPFRNPRPGESGPGLGGVHRVLFGVGGDDGESGQIMFDDAWMTPDSLGQGLGMDVLTPHHSEYYGGADKAPTDFDDPIPVSFLSLSGCFEVVLSVAEKGDEANKWLNLAMDLVKASLDEWGVGAKTSSGYGRLGGAPIRPKNAQFKVGDKVTVTCIEKGKKRGKPTLKFEACDGFKGLFPGKKPEVDVGDSLQAWVNKKYDLSQGGYRFSLTPPE